MSIREIIQRIFHTFLLAWALVSAGMCGMSLVFNWEILLVEHLLAMFSMTALACLTYFVFYSRRELNVKQFIFRLALQFCLIIAIVLWVGLSTGLIGDRPLITVVTVITAILITTVMIIIEICKTWLVADKLNIKLSKRTTE